MREDFEFAKQELNQIGIVQLCRNSKVLGTLSSPPVSVNKHWSLCLYPADNRFTDFANANYSDDIIRFVSYIKGVNNWDGALYTKFLSLKNIWKV